MNNPLILCFIIDLESEKKHNGATFWKLTFLTMCQILQKRIAFLCQLCLEAQKRSISTSYSIWLKDKLEQSGISFPTELNSPMSLPHITFYTPAGRNDLTAGL